MATIQGALGARLLGTGWHGDRHGMTIYSCYNDVMTGQQTDSHVLLGKSECISHHHYNLTSALIGKECKKVWIGQFAVKSSKPNTLF